MKKFKLSKGATLVLSLLTSVGASASTWQNFVDGSTFDMKLRTSATKMESSASVNNTYSGAEATALLYAFDPVTAQGLADMVGGTPEALAAFLSSDDPMAQAYLADATAGLNSELENGVKEAADVSQGGASAWLEFQSGYLFDVVGFDLGYQGGVKTYNHGTGTFIIDPNEDNLSRISTARAKLRFGDEDRNVYIDTGRGRIKRPHFGVDDMEFLLDKTYEASQIEFNWDEFTVYAISATGVGGVTDDRIYKPEDFEYFAQAGFDRMNSIGAEYDSDYGTVQLAHSTTKDYLATSTFIGKGGLPLSWLGMPISPQNEYKHLLLAQFNYNYQQSGDKFQTEYGVDLPNHDSFQYEVMLGLQFDNLRLLTSFNQVGDAGFFKVGTDVGGGSTILPGYALINSWSKPEQQTMSYVATYNAEDFSLPGLDLSFIYFDSSNINKDTLLAEGDLEYYLTGEEEFTEWFFDITYTIQEGALEGLSFRGVTGKETNQAKISGSSLWIEYNYSFM